MSKHWRPDGKVVRIRPAGRWTRRGAYLGPAPQGGRGSLAVWLAAAVTAGVAGGGIWSWSENQAPDGRPSIQSVIASASEAIHLPGLRTVNYRLPRASGARNDAVRTRFAFCHAGGGNNCVVDGDTFYIGGEKVRIAGIDAPETHPPRCAEEARLGEAATERLQALLNSGAVTMTSIDRDRDSYGRMLRNVQ